MRVLASQLGYLLLDGAAVALLWCAAFLQENEAGEIESTLETWWEESDRRRRASGSVLAAFVCTVAAATGRVLDAVFGREQLSFRFVAISASATIASINAVLFYRNPDVSERLLAIGVAVVLIALASDYFGRRTLPSFLFVAATIGALLYQWVWWNFHRTWPITASLNILTFGTFPERFVGSVAAVLAASILSNVAIIGAARWLVRAVASGISFWRMTELLVVGAVVPAAFVGAPLWGPFFISGDIRTASHEWALIQIVYTGYANIPSASVFIVFLALGLAMLLHRLFWGAVRRPLYAVGTKFHLFRQTKTLCLTGLTLLSFRHAGIATPLRSFAEKSGFF